jgi:hypothetical protein
VSTLDDRLVALVDAIKAKFDTQQSEIDPTLRSDLAASSGSALVTWLPVPTGVQGLDLQTALRVGLAVNVKWFGAVGDGVTDDSAAFVAAIAYLNSIAGNPANNGIYKASPKLFIPAGSYYMGTTTLDITHTLIIEGEGGQGFGAGGGCSTMLRWAPNTTAFRFQAYNTSGATNVDNVNLHTSSAGSYLRDLYIYGPSGSTGLLSTNGLSEGEYHGIHVKATIYCDNVMVEGFQGDALYAHTSIGSGSPNEGQSNLCRYYNCVFRNSRNGASIQGGDSNAQVFVGCQFVFNRACGVDDQSFLGNTYIHPHAAGNGISHDNLGTAAFPAYVVSNGGNRYCPVQGQETAASTTAPSGTADTSIWYYIGAGGATAGIPAWVSGISLRCGAPYRTNNANSVCSFLNPYEEGGQGFSQFHYPTTIHGGTHGQGYPKGSGAMVGCFTGGIYGMFGPGGIGYVNPATGAANVLNQAGLSLQPADGSDNRQLQWFNGNLAATRSNLATTTFWPFRLTGVNTLLAIGKDLIDCPNGLGLMGTAVMGVASAPPTGAQGNGANWPIGSVLFNSAPAVGSAKGWQCTVAGAPGTWVSMGNL